MFDYFRNYSSNANQVCCDDSPTKGLYDHLSIQWPLFSVKVTSASQTWLLFNLQYLGQYLNSYIQTFHDGRLMDALYIYPHAHFYDLDLMQGHSGSAKPKAKSQQCMLSATKQAISIKLATMVGHFLRDLDLDFATVHMACPSFLFCWKVKNVYTPTCGKGL